VPFLALNGWDLKIEKASESVDLLGSYKRAFSGKLLTDRRTLKRRWKLTTGRLKELDAFALINLLEGRGHGWTWEGDLYSSKGLNVNGATVASLRRGRAADGSFVVDESGVAESKYGTYSMVTDAAITNMLTANQGSVETDTTGFTAIDGATISRTTSHAFEGSASLQVVTAAAVNAVRGGVETTVASASAATQYIGSFYAKAPAGSTISIRCRLVDSTGAGGVSKTVALNADKWTRITTNAYTTAGGTTGIKLEVLEDVADSNITFQLDGLMIQTGALAGTWVAGASSRSASSLNYPVASFATLTDLTINFWARSPTANYTPGYITFTRWNAGSFSMEITRPTNTNLVSFTTSFGTSDTRSYSNPWDGQWHMITATLRSNPESGEVIKALYVDGVLRSSSSPANHPLLWSGLTQLNVGQVGAGGERIGLHNTLMCDLMIVPYAMPAALVSGIYNFGRSVANLPRLVFNGDMVPEDFVTAEGSVSPSEYVRFTDAGSWRANARRVEFELVEV
jgi:hypothetical protein